MSYYDTPQYLLYDGVHRTDAKEVERALANGARWDLSQWGEEVGDSRAKELVCQMLGRNRDFSRITGPYLPNQSSFAVLDLMLSSWPEKWPHWDGPLVGMMRILHLCAWKINSDTVEFLLQKGADPNGVEYDGSTALHVAKDPQVIQSLLDGGASLGHEDDNGFTALDKYVGLTVGYTFSQKTRPLTSPSLLKISKLAQATLSHPKTLESVGNACQDLVLLLEGVKQTPLHRDQYGELNQAFEKYACARRLQKLSKLSLVGVNNSPDKRPAPKIKF